MEWIFEPQGWIAFTTLLALEVVLGIDNVVFLSILAGKLPAPQQPKARFVGLGLAMFLRIALLFSLSLVIRLTAPLLAVLGHQVSGRDLILIGGGLFLLAKSTHEIHQKLEGQEGESSARVKPTFTGVIIQILLLDLIFSLDSVITAVGMVESISLMISAVVVAVAFMMVFAAPLSRFVEQHPTFKMLALSFLLLIGLSLVAEGWHLHIPKPYVYFAMAFSVFVEILNMKFRRPKRTPVKLREPYVERAEPAG
jgi:predicted tellurium resistance membrane protein TerC